MGNKKTVVVNTKKKVQVKNSNNLKQNSKKTNYIEYLSIVLFIIIIAVCGFLIYSFFQKNPNNDKMIYTTKAKTTVPETTPPTTAKVEKIKPTTTTTKAVNRIFKQKVK